MTIKINHSEVYSYPKGYLIWSPEGIVYGLSPKTIGSNIQILPVFINYVDFTLKAHNSYRESLLVSPTWKNPNARCNIWFYNPEDAIPQKRLVIKQPGLERKVSTLSEAFKVNNFPNIVGRFAKCIAFMPGSNIKMVYGLIVERENKTIAIKDLSKLPLFAGK